MTVTGPSNGSLFPPEIVDAIIDYLHDTNKALAACSLTCSSFLPASRYHQFSRVRVIPTTFHIFLRLVTEPSNNISAFVRHLDFSGNFDGFDEETHRNDLAAMKSCLPALDSLSVSNSSFGKAPPAAKFSVFESITHLELKSLHLASFSDAIDLICAFTNLESLSVKYTLWHLGSTIASVQELRPLARPLQICGLDLRTRQATPLVEWLLDQDPMPEVRSLTLDEQFFEPTAIPVTCRLIQSSCHSLEHLELSLPHSSYHCIEEDLNIFMNIRYCMNIRSLNIMTIDLSSDNAFMWLIQAWIPKFLAQIVSQHLQEISFQFFLETRSDLDSFDWDAVGEILSRSRFPHLQKIRIRLIDSGPSFRAQSYLQKEQWVSRLGEWIVQHKISVFQVERRSIQIEIEG